MGDWAYSEQKRTERLINSKTHMYKNQNSGTKKPTTGENAIKGVKNFLKGRKNIEEEDFTVIINRYNDEEIKIGHGIERLGEEICNEIQKDFSKFVKWFKKTY